ncbi:hypothetical protein [Bradyrhizobium archetypum]|uniref:Uncharacterized protein n=1 Tax=Bradyrhizobium archetypum TaxID=2721160 RepID=A0A7Y4HBE0_9BRAD|nr:hypothetical protein [Bradyrhizobium archetypum]NOJ50202.1 hypothetical protein [Bradyrhizobium archetypum]
MKCITFAAALLTLTSAAHAGPELEASAGFLAGIRSIDVTMHRVRPHRSGAASRKKCPASVRRRTSTPITTTAVRSERCVRPIDRSHKTGEIVASRIAATKTRASAKAFHRHDQSKRQSTVRNRAE